MEPVQKRSSPKLKKSRETSGMSLECFPNVSSDTSVSPEYRHGFMMEDARGVDLLNSSEDPVSAEPSAVAAARKRRFVGVRQRPSGRWVAEIKDTTQKIRLWLGTYDTAEEAARAYDEAACLLRGNNTRTNFLPSSSAGQGSVLQSKAARLLHLRRNTATQVDGQQQPDHGNKGKEQMPRDHDFSALSEQQCTLQFATTQQVMNDNCRMDLEMDQTLSRDLSSVETMKMERENIQSDIDARYGQEDVLLNTLPMPQKKGLDLAQEGVVADSVQMERNDHFGLMQGNVSDFSNPLLSLDEVNPVYPSPFDFVADIALPCFNGNPIVGHENEEQSEDNLILHETIQQMNYERAMSASLYAMAGVAERVWRIPGSNNEIPTGGSRSLPLPSSFQTAQRPKSPVFRASSDSGWKTQLEINASNYNAFG